MSEEPYEWGKQYRDALEKLAKAANEVGRLRSELKGAIAGAQAAKFEYDAIKEEIDRELREVGL